MTTKLKMSWNEDKVTCCSIDENNHMKDVLGYASIEYEPNGYRIIVSGVNGSPWKSEKGKSLFPSRVIAESLLLDLVLKEAA